MSGDNYNSKKILAAHERILASSSVRALGLAAGQEIPTILIPEEESSGAVRRITRAIKPAQKALKTLLSELGHKGAGKKLERSQGIGGVIVSESPDRVELRIVVNLRHDKAGVIATNTPKNGGEPLQLVSGLRPERRYKK